MHRLKEALHRDKDKERVGRSTSYEKYAITTPAAGSTAAGGAPAIALPTSSSVGVQPLANQSTVVAAATPAAATLPAAGAPLSTVSPRPVSTGMPAPSAGLTGTGMLQQQQAPQQTRVETTVTLQAQGAVSGQTTVPVQTNLPVETQVRISLSLSLYAMTYSM